MSLVSVESSPGGHIAALTTMEMEDQQVLLAPSGDRLFFRAFDEASWRSNGAHWPAGVDAAGLALFDGVQQSVVGEKLPPERFFASGQGQLWTVATPGAGRAPLLLSSADGGQNWEIVDLPDSLRQGPTRPLARPTSRPVLRLTVDEDRLFVDDGRRLWRWVDGEEEVEGDEEVDELQWEEVSLRGASLGDRTPASQGDPLPARLRHYLPAGPDGAPEVVTVYRRELKIYSRGADDEEFERRSTLDVLDRHLVRVGSQDVLFLVSAEVVFRSNDGGESWEELAIARDLLAPQDYRQLVVFEGQEEEGFELWLLGERGGLWRSDDGGESWEEAVEHDPDGRGLTGLVAEDESTFWAATQGRGVLRSSDRGQSWETTNTGLRAGRTYDAVLLGGGAMYVGTDAGLFERRAGEGQVRREWIDERATSALYWDGETERLIRGTAGGGIIVDVGGNGETPEMASLAERDVVEYLPPHLRGMQPPAAAIIDLVAEPGSEELVAWSHRRGPLVSGDGGATWRRLQLGEAFQNAIEGAVVTQFLGMPDQTYFAVTRVRDRNAPTQLWRSVDGGTTWQATHSFMESADETPMQLMRLPDGRGLLRAQGSRLAVSTDLGENWATVSGPWDSGQLLGMALDGDQVVVVLELNHTTLIAWLDDPIQGGEVARSHHLVWPSSEAAYRTRPVALDIRDEEILLNEGGRIYSARTPHQATEGPAAVSTLIGMGVVLLLTTMAFGYLRIWERE